MSSPIKKLDEIFSRFNTSLSELYGDLLELSPSENYRRLIIYAFNETLNDTSSFYKIISSLLFKAE
jgi:hypothetical protein